MLGFFAWIVITLGMFISLLALDEIARWALFPILLILSREFLITGLRLVAAGRGKTLAAEKIGKLKTVIQLNEVFINGGRAIRKVYDAEPKTPVIISTSGTSPCQPCGAREGL